MARCKRDRNLSILNKTGGGGGSTGILESGATTFETFGQDTGTPSDGTDIPTGAANAKGAWTEIAASTSADSTGIIIHFNEFTVGREYLIDIGTGAAASEVVVVPDLYLTHNGSGIHNQNVFVPLQIVAGTRVSMRQQNDLGSGTVNAHITFVQGGATGFSSVENIGADTSVSTGTKIDNPLSAGTKSGYFELTAATSSAIRSVILIVVLRNETLGSRNALIDIASGGAGSEVNFVENIGVSADTAGDGATMLIGPVPVTIAAGTRIAARAQYDFADANAYVNIELLGLVT